MAAPTESLPPPNDGNAALVPPTQAPAAEVDGSDEALPTEGSITVVDVPLLDDGTLDVVHLNLNDKEQRALFTAQVAEVCRHHGAQATVSTVMPRIVDLARYDDAASALAMALPEIGLLLQRHAADLDVFTSDSDTDVDREIITDTMADTDPGAADSDALPISPFLELRTVMDILLWHVDGQVGAQAAKALCDIIDQPETSLGDRQDFVRLAHTLSTSRWCAPKCSAAAMLPTAFRVAMHLHDNPRDRAGSPRGPRKATVDAAMTAIPNDAVRAQAVFTDLCRDREVPVRRSAARNLGLWIQELTPNDALAYLKPLIREFASEAEQDSLRFSVIPHLVAMAKLSHGDAESFVLPLAINLCRDSSWRVRWSVSQHLVAFMLLSSDAASALVDSIVLLAGDEEAEVRASIATSIGSMAPTLVPAVVSSKIVPLVQQLCADPSLNVRAAVSSSLCDVCRCADTPEALELIDVVAKLIEDDSDQVQLNILRSLPALQDKLDLPGVMSRIGALLLRVSRVAASRWRVRERVAEQLRHLAVHVQRDQTGAFEAMVASLLVDPVAEVRLTVARSLPHLASRFGAGWVRHHVMNFSEKLGRSTGFRDRQVYVRVLEMMLPFATDAARCGSAASTDSRPQSSDTIGSSSSAPTSPERPPGCVVDDTVFWERVDGDVFALAHDPVSNVRLNVARWLGSAPARPVPTLERHLTRLKQLVRRDADDDVRRVLESNVEAPF